MLKRKTQMTNTNQTKSSNQTKTSKTYTPQQIEKFNNYIDSIKNDPYWVPKF